MFADIKLAVATENDGMSAWRDIFTMGDLQYFRRICLAFGAQAMQQLSGINVMAYYGTVVFKQSVGMSEHLALLMGGFTSLAFWAGTVVSLPIVDRFGRRPLLLWGATFMSIGMAITAIGTSRKGDFQFGAAATFGIFFFYFNFGIGFQIVPWLYGVEITPLKLRYIAGAVSAASGWIWNYAVVQVTQPGIANIGYKYFIIWTILNFCFVWVIYFFYPETAKLTLEELDYIFMRPADRPQIMERQIMEDDEKQVSVSSKPFGQAGAV
ncbi:hypothetical protein MMC08_000658 [Hypocenomyce scalaris]|nr:hypothetical protein [Hypocenomyce scalaris]